MSAERCPECGAEGVACECAPGAGFNPLRIRPYVSLSDPGQSGSASAYPQPVLGAMADPARPSAGNPFGPFGPPGEAPTELLPPVPPAAAPSHDTPAYGIPVQPQPPQAWSDHTIPLRPVPPTATGAPAPHTPRGAPRKRKQLVLLLAGACTVVALGGTALALALGGSSEPGKTDTALLDAKPSGPVASLAPTGSPEASPSPKASRSASPSPSASRSASPSASASRSASPSPTPSTSRSTAPPTSTPPPKPSRTPKPQSPPPPPVQGPTLAYGDSGSEVKKLQQLLSGQGLYRGRVDGRYGRSVENAVSEFQWYNDIQGDPWGVYGPATRRALEG
ncbi:peptidoglycan-binding protein [Streptomyces sp. NPDC054952]